MPPGRHGLIRLNGFLDKYVSMQVSLSIDALVAHAKSMNENYGNKALTVFVLVYT